MTDHVPVIMGSMDDVTEAEGYLKRDDYPLDGPIGTTSLLVD